MKKLYRELGAAKLERIRQVIHHSACFPGLNFVSKTPPISDTIAGQGSAPPPPVTIHTTEAVHPSGREHWRKMVVDRCVTRAARAELCSEVLLLYFLGRASWLTLFAEFFLL